MGKRVIYEDELKEIQSKLTMESDVMNKCTKKIIFDVAAKYKKATPE